jgi:predicted HTH transcriptional regulator
MTQDKIVAITRPMPAINAKAIGTRLVLTTCGIEKSIQGLKTAVIVERFGPAKGGHWVVKAPAK